MKERRQKEEAHRSAVSGKKIKLKIKKSSKDKEVNNYLLYFFQQSRRSVGNFNSHSTAMHEGKKGLGTESPLSPHEISVSLETLLSIVAIYSRVQIWQ